MSDSPLQELAHVAPEMEVNPMVGMAAIALQMAMKYHDINTIQDGTLYQQYKLEGRNLQTLSINMVFETAMQIERHLLDVDRRIAEQIMDALDEPEMLEEGQDEATP